MKLPLINQVSKNKSVVFEFKGYNHTLTAADGEFYDMKNLSADKYPYMETRKPRSLYRSLTKANGLFAKNALAWVDGTGFFYDGVQKGTVTDGKKQFISMGAYLLIFPDKKYYNTATDAFGDLEASWSQTASASIANAFLTDTTVSADNANVYIKISSTGIGKAFNQYDAVELAGITDGTVAALNKTAVIYQKADDWILVVGFDMTGTVTQASGITVKRKVPDMDYLTEMDNRVWGCSSVNHEIYASKLGDPFNWSAYEGISTDSYAVTVGTDGDFTGAVTHMGYVIFFKEDCIHKVYGNKPSNFQVQTSQMRGVKAGSDQSLAIVNEVLYYQSRGDVCAYQGALPASISKVFGEEIYSYGAAGANGNKYYLSTQGADGNWTLFVYDGSQGIWMKEDDTHAEYFTYLDGELYYLDGNDIKKVGGEAETFEWMAETGELFAGTTGKKKVSRLQYQMDLGRNTFVEVSVSYDGGLWQKVHTITADQERTVAVPVIPHRCDSYRIRLRGRGYCLIRNVTKTIEMGE